MKNLGQHTVVEEQVPGTELLGSKIDKAGDLHARAQEYQKAYERLRGEISALMVAQDVTEAAGAEYKACIQETTEHYIDPVEFANAVSGKVMRDCMKVVLANAKDALDVAKYAKLEGARPGPSRLVITKVPGE